MNRYVFSSSFVPSQVRGFSARCLHTTSSPGGTVGRGSFFAFLSLPKTPDLSAADVQRSYHNLQRRVHPDLTTAEEFKASEARGVSNATTSAETSGAASEARMVASVDDSTYANLSYETLRDPFRRCKYLSRLSRAEAVKGAPLSPVEEEELMSDDDGRSVSDNQKLRSAGEDLTLSDDFLSVMMAANEYVFCREDTEEYRNKLVILIAYMEERNVECYERAKGQWKAEDFQGFRRSVLEWTYIRNILTHAKESLATVTEGGAR